MQDYTITNYHVQYMSVHQHWCPRSEKYAGGDALLTALYHGWVMNNVVYVEDFWLAGVRRVQIFHFSLKRGNETMTMPVILNPAVNRLVQNADMRLVEIQVSEPMRAENSGD